MKQKIQGALLLLFGQNTRGVCFACACYLCQMTELCDLHLPRGARVLHFTSAERKTHPALSEVFSLMTPLVVFQSVAIAFGKNRLKEFILTLNFLMFLISYPQKLPSSLWFSELFSFMTMPLCSSETTFHSSQSSKHFNFYQDMFCCTKLINNYLVKKI